MKETKGCYFSRLKAYATISHGNRSRLSKKTEVYLLFWSPSRGPCLSVFAKLFISVTRGDFPPPPPAFSWWLLIIYMGIKMGNGSPSHAKHEGMWGGADKCCKCVLSFTPPKGDGLDWTHVQKCMCSSWTLDTTLLKMRWFIHGQKNTQIIWQTVWFWFEAFPRVIICAKLLISLHIWIYICHILTGICCI